MPSPNLIPACTGVLVAGGHATRLGGIPKGLLRIGGEPIVQRSLGLFRGLFEDVLVVANDPGPYAQLGARIVPDAIAGKGVPGGLHAALGASPTEWVFTAACDMPFLSEEAIRFLAGLRGDAPAAGVVWNGRFEGLHAFWSRRCLSAVERMLRDGDPSLWQLATVVGARLVSEEDWRAIDPTGRAFANANTPEDAARLGLLAPG